MRFLFILPFLFFLGCVSYTPISFDELKPADYFINRKVASVSLVNTGNLQRDVSHFLVVGDKAPQPIDSIWSDDFNSLVLRSFCNDLSLKEFFDTVLLDTTALFVKHHGFSSSAPQLFLDSIANARASQGIFVLSQSSYKTYVKIDPIFSNVFYGYLEGISAVKFDFYNAIDRQFEDSFSIADTIYFDGQTGTIDQLNDLLPTPTVFTTQMATHIGEKIAKRYIPYWQTVYRGVFTGGTYFLIEGGKYVAVKNWPEATKVWRFAVDKGSEIVKARASYNLAVMAEMQGDLVSASAWLNESLLHYNKKTNSYGEEIINAKNYLAIVEARALEFKKLNDQIDEPR